LITSEASARICFFGDHQDYLNLPVIAGTIDRKIKIKATPNLTATYFLQLLDLEKTITIDLNKKNRLISSGDYYRSSMEGYDIEISGTIPINAGISSSSALVVAWLRFLVQAQEVSSPLNNKTLGVLAYAAESLYFKQPGGLMDQYTIAQGGLLFINTKSGSTTKLPATLGKLVVAESGIYKETLTVLQNARTFGQNALEFVLKKEPNFDIHTATVGSYNNYLQFVPDEYKNHWYAAIHNHLLTQEAKKALQTDKPNLKGIGTLMNAHQTILEERIQNTPISMKIQMDAARSAGALGAKIIGSGGGGCMVAMVTEDTLQPVINAFLATGTKAAYEVNLTKS
jgi:galactokinase